MSNHDINFLSLLVLSKVNTDISGIEEKYRTTLLHVTVFVQLLSHYSLAPVTTEKYYIADVVL